MLLFDVLWTLHFDCLGARVVCGLVWDTATKAHDKLDICERFALELGIPVRKKKNRLYFPFGSYIEAISAGGKNPGRSASYNRLHWSETHYYGARSIATYTEIKACLVEGGSETIETTMNANDALSVHLYEQDNDLDKVFYPVSWNNAYRRPDLGSELTESDRERLTKNGFDMETEDGQAAGAWWKWALNNKCAGDETQLKREYPQTIAQAFAVNQGRWVPVTPDIANPRRVHEFVGIRGDTWQVEEYVDPEDVKGRCVVAIDTADNIGQDRCTVLVMDERDFKVCAAFASDRILIEDLAMLGHEMWVHYTIGPGAGERPMRYRVPDLLCEKGGVGSATFQALETRGVPAVPIITTGKNTHANTKFRGMLRARRAIEEGLVYGPAVLAEECRKCTYEKAEFKGYKDMLMTVGFCILHLDGLTVTAKRDQPVNPKGWQAVHDRLAGDGRVWG